MLEQGELAVIAGLFADQIGFGLETAVAADMIDLHSMAAQDAPNQQAAVAAGRILLAAKEGHTEFAETLLQAREPFLKERGLSHTVIKHMSFAIVKLGPGGPSSQLVPHVEVADVMGGQRGLQKLSIELARVFRIGLGARVGHDPDLMTLEQAEEGFHRMIGMPYGQDARWGFSHAGKPA